MQDDRSNIQLENGLTERGRKPSSSINSAEVSSKSKNGQMNEFPECSPKVNKNKSATLPNGVHPKPKKEGKLLNQGDNPLSMSVSKEETSVVDVDKAPQSDTTLRKEQEGKRDSEIKKGKCSTKVNSDAVEIKKRIAEAPGDLILEERAEILSYGEENKNLGSANELGQKNGDDGYFKKTNHQGSEGKGTPKPNQRGSVLLRRWGEKEGETKSVTVEDKSNSEKRNHTKSVGGISLENQVLTSEYPSELECFKLDGEISGANLQSETLKTNLDADRIEPTEKGEVPSKDEERVDNGNMAEGVCNCSLMGGNID
ncbi:hypothetical protein ACFE04_023928 [Oxalis oulophora]